MADTDIPLLTKVTSYLLDICWPRKLDNRKISETGVTEGMSKAGRLYSSCCLSKTMDLSNVEGKRQRKLLNINTSFPFCQAKDGYINIISQLQAWSRPTPYKTIIQTNIPIAIHYHAPRSKSNRDSSFCASSTSFFAFMRM